MRTDLFDFDLPEELIAQSPVTPRDAARLLVVGEGIADRRVRDLPDLLAPGDLLVYNDTRVVPARLDGRRLRGEGTGARVEITLHKEVGPAVWTCFLKPARKVRVGDEIRFTPDLDARVEETWAGGEAQLAFGCSREALFDALRRHGRMPLPPYIRRDGDKPGDREDYQTVFAIAEGAVAAPTAGLHFTPRLLDRLGERGIELAALTLHVGGGTFLPVKAESVEQHRIHAETGLLTEQTAARVNETRDRGGRIVALGTTSLRLLESAADESCRVHPFHDETGLFILPGYRFRAVDILMTNFHLPRSTLFMLVSAFAGLERMKAAYEHAKSERYRFYSYGDACLLYPPDLARP